VLGAGCWTYIFPPNEADTGFEFGFEFEFEFVFSDSSWDKSVRPSRFKTRLVLQSKVSRSNITHSASSNMSNRSEEMWHRIIVSNTRV